MALPTEDDLAKLPAARGIYQITDGTVSYVGLSDNIRLRVRKHLESRSCRSRIVIDTGRARFVVLELLPRAGDRTLAEREWYWFARLQQQNQVLVNDPNSLGRTPSGRYGPPAGVTVAGVATETTNDGDATAELAAERQSPWLWWVILAGAAFLSFGGGYFAVKQWLLWRDARRMPEPVTFETPPPPTTDCQASLKQGDRGDAVRQLQAQLQQLGFYNSTLDGVFGPGTQVAVSAFQRQQGLEDDAIVGCETQQAIQTAIAAEAASN